MSAFELYVLFMLPRVGEMLGELAWLCAGIVLLGAFVLSWARLIISVEHDAAALAAWKRIAARARPLAPWLLLLWLGCWTAAVLVPDQSAMYALVGAYAVTNVDGIEALGPNFVEAANAFLQSYSASVGSDGE